MDFVSIGMLVTGAGVEVGSCVGSLVAGEGELGVGWVDGVGLLLGRGSLVGVGGVPVLVGGDSVGPVGVVVGGGSLGGEVGGLPVEVDVSVGGG